MQMEKYGRKWNTVDLYGQPCFCYHLYIKQKGGEKMRAGQVYIKVPISAISYDETDSDVSKLKESIKTCGLLQPVGIVLRDTGYKLIFGHRRIKACRELDMQYIHAVLLTVREGEEEIFALNENIHRRQMPVSEIAQRVLKAGSGGIEEMLSLSREQAQDIKNYLVLNTKAKEMLNENNEQYLSASKGESEYFIRMCRLARQIPVTAAEHVRVSVMSDKRIFINEIEKIIKLMRQGGYGANVSEDEEKIIIQKRDRAG